MKVASGGKNVPFTKTKYMANNSIKVSTLAHNVFKDIKHSFKSLPRLEVQ